MTESDAGAGPSASAVKKPSKKRVKKEKPPPAEPSSRGLPPALEHDVTVLREDAGELCAVLDRQLSAMLSCSMDEAELESIRDRAEHLALDVRVLGGLLKRFQILWFLQKALSSAESIVKDNLSRSAEALKCVFGQLGLSEIRTSLLVTFLKRSVHGSLIASTKDEAIKKLKAEGLGFLVKEEVNRQTFDKWVREQQTDEREMPIIPDAIRPYVSVVEMFEVKGRKA